MVTLVEGNLYQWDTGRVVQIDPDSGYVIHEVHFTTKKMDFAYVAKTYIENGNTYCKIPNILLQQYYDIYCYEVRENADGEESVSTSVFKVIKRNRPADYIYTETEKFTYKELEHRVKALEEFVRNQVITTSGDGSAYTATVEGVTSLSTGMSFTIIPHVESTETTPTLNVNNLGAKLICRRATSDTNTTTAGLTPYWLKEGKPINIMYDGNSWIADLSKPDAYDIMGIVQIQNGGTGATTAAEARVNLGIETPGGTVISTNADYAEVGEWSDGNPDGEDRVGYFVSLDTSEPGKTMVKATTISDVRGVTMRDPAFASNASADKYDSNGKLLAHYDYVCFAGFAPVIDNGLCAVNERCVPADDGTAKPSPNNLGYQVIERIDATRVLVLVEPQADVMVRIKDDINHINERVESGDIPFVETDPTVPAWAKQPTKPTYTAAEVGALPDTYTPPNQTAQQVGADPAGTATTAVSQHNVDTSAHNDLRLALQGLSDRVNAALDSDDTTLDQMSEVVAYIKSNKTLIDVITTSKVSIADIVNDLVTNAVNKPLSAAQGVALKKLIDDLQKMIQEGGSGIAVTGATVGQTVKISAVDESGKPTAWEAADFPSGGGNVDLTDEEYATLVALLEEE